MSELDSDSRHALFALEGRVMRYSWNFQQWQAFKDADTEVWIAFEDTHQLIGFVLNKKLQDLQGIHLLKIAVDEHYQGKGFAQILLRQSLIDCAQQSFEWIELEVESSNSRALSLYQRLGFTLQRKVKGFYSDGAEAQILRLDLKSLI
jgi:ribosomal protein S18 acetylase RimI-like enzyme